MATMTFGADTNGSVYSSNIFEKKLDLTDAEKSAIDVIFKAFSEQEISSAEIHPERRSTNYLSIVAFSDYDFIRLKMGEKAKWVSVFLSPKDRSELASDVRFAGVSNKKQIHWKVSLSTVEDLEKHVDLFQLAFSSASWSYQKTISKG